MSKLINPELIYNTTFGVEIETACISRATAASAVAVMFGTNRMAHRPECGYDRYSAYDALGREWAFVKDSSITGEDGYSDIYGGCELNTPPLTYADMDLLQEVVRTLRKAGAKSGPEYGCGIHVHVSGKGHTPKSLSNFVNLIYSNYTLISKALGVTTSRLHWCRDFSDGHIDELEFCKKFKKAKTIEEQSDIWYSNFAGSYEDRNAHYNSSRYHLINLHRFFSTYGKASNTIEIRAFNATLHAGEVRAYVLLVLSMNAQALTQKTIRAEKNPVMLAGNEKFAMRTWLNRMGWTGSMYKNPHALFISKLQGDSAWRFGRNNDLYL